MRVRVVGAASDDDAAKARRRIAEAQLTKCSWYGEDPYWGRVVSEAASAGAAFDVDKVSVAYGDIVVADGGVAVAHDAEAVAEHMQRATASNVTVDLRLGQRFVVAAHQRPHPRLRRREHGHVVTASTSAPRRRRRFWPRRCPTSGASSARPSS